MTLEGWLPPVGTFRCCRPLTALRSFLSMGLLTQDCDEVLHLVQTSLVQPAFPTPFALLPALPQPQAGLATLVVVPEWVPGSLRRVVIL